MQLNCRSITVGLPLALLLTTSMAAAQNERPSNQRLNQPAATFLDFAPPPQELSTMAARSMAVVRVQVIHSDGPILLPNSGGLVGRYQTVRIIEALKETKKMPPQSLIRIFEYGGTVDVDGKEVSTRFEGVPLREGEEAVLFLEKPAGIDGYTVAHGDAGLFRVDNGKDRVTVPTTAKAFVRDFNARSSLSRAEFFALLHRAVGKEKE